MPGQINPIATSYNWRNWILDTIELTDPGPYGNIFPYDMDNDGDNDLVGYRSSTILAVYINDGLGNFTVQNIENVSSFYGGAVWPVWVRDVDLNGLPDILAPMGSGLYVYYQTAPLVFTRQTIVIDGPYWCGTYISYADAGDVDNDGDVDIVATNGCGPGGGGGGGDVILLRNDGSTWTPIMIYDSHPTDNNYKAMRIYLVDFNSDGYLDILTSYWPVMVFRNTGGSFTLSNYFGGTTHNSDGSWPIDVDGDGDIDIVYAPYQSTPYYLSYLRNDGGFTFVRVNVSSGFYYDGLYSGDFNADGFSDFLGAWSDFDVYVGPSWTRYNLSTGWNIHNLYFANIETYGCVDIQQNIVFTNLSGSSWATGHYLYRNRTATSYASYATLTSSVLYAPIGACSFDTLFYLGCAPSNWQMNVYVRWAFDSTVISSRPWVGPVSYGTSLQSLGLNPYSDNFIQYRVDFVRLGPPTDNAPRLDSIWIKPNCSVLVGDSELKAYEDKTVIGKKGVIYTVDGRKIKVMKKGIYFIVDGRRVKKVMVK